MKLTYRALVSHYGRHRATHIPRLVDQRFVTCPRCGVDTAATVHGSTLLCAEGHIVTGGAR